MSKHPRKTPWKDPRKHQQRSHQAIQTNLPLLLMPLKNTLQEGGQRRHIAILFNHPPVCWNPKLRSHFCDVKKKRVDVLTQRFYSHHLPKCPELQDSTTPRTPRPHFSQDREVKNFAPILRRSKDLVMAQVCLRFSCRQGAKGTKQQHGGTHQRLSPKLPWASPEANFSTVASCQLPKGKRCQKLQKTQLQTISWGVQKKQKNPWSQSFPPMRHTMVSPK